MFAEGKHQTSAVEDNKISQPSTYDRVVTADGR